jgi:hypothetical protein
MGLPISSLKQCRGVGLEALLRASRSLLAPRRAQGLP